MSTVTDQIIARAAEFRRREGNHTVLARMAIDSAVGSMCYKSICQDELIDAAAYALVAAERVEVVKNHV